MRKNRYENQIRAVRISNSHKQTNAHIEKRLISRNGYDDSLTIIAKRKNQELFFDSQVECAKALKVTRQLVSQSLNHPEKYKTVRGFVISTIDESEG